MIENYSEAMKMEFWYELKEKVSFHLICGSSLEAVFISEH